MKLRSFLFLLGAGVFSAQAMALSIRWDLGTNPIPDNTNGIYLVANQSNVTSSSSDGEVKGIWGTASSTGTSVNASFDPWDRSKIEIDGIASLSNGNYYYLVVFSGGTKDNPNTYAVYNAGQYTGDGTSPQQDIGVYAPKADGSDLAWGDYVNITFVHSGATPEPTVFALVSLGCCVALLRRRKGF